MYYSDAALVTTPRGYALLVDMTEGTMTGIAMDGLKELLDTAKAVYYPKEKYVVLRWEDIIWNADNEKEQALYKALEELQGRGIGYKFLRAGEQPKDVEEINCWEKGCILPDLYLKREIKIWPDDGPGEDLTFLKDINPICYRKLLLRSAVGFYETV